MTPWEKRAVYMAGILGAIVTLLTIIWLLLQITTPHSPVINVNNYINGEVVLNKSSNINHVNLSDEELKNQANELAKNISGFVGNSNIKEKELIPVFDYNMTNETNLTDSRKDWIKDTNQRIIFEEQTLKTFNERFLGDAIRIRSEFLKRNISDMELESFLWHPNYHQMQDIPISLHEMASKLP